jgi:hypothetical protein
MSSPVASWTGFRKSRVRQRPDPKPPPLVAGAADTGLTAQRRCRPASLRLQLSEEFSESVRNDASDSATLNTHPADCAPLARPD